MKYRFGTYKFRTKSDSAKFFSYLLRRKLPLKDDEPEAVFDLFKCHPDFDLKCGEGFDRLEAEDDGSGRNFCFWVYRVDGSRVRFSYKTAITGKPATHRANFSEAARREIIFQVAAFRRTLPEPCPCSITGMPYSLCHIDVDHYPETFVSIMDEFIESEGLDINTVQYDKTQSLMNPSWLFDDRVLAERWQDFHRARAKYRALHRISHYMVTSFDAANRG